jgi:predicted RNase H-like HicB family nuclease
MRRYFALVEKETDSAFGIRFPDLPAVFSAADEERDILANAVEALQLYFEDMNERPAASSYEAVIARDDVREALAAGAYLISVPLIENDTEVIRANVTFERGLLKTIDSAAKARGLSRSAFLAVAARHEMEA